MDCWNKYILSSIPDRLLSFNRVKKFIVPTFNAVIKKNPLMHQKGLIEVDS